MKTHLTYTLSGIQSGAAYCGNNARKYKYGLKLSATAIEFRSLPSSERCAHCENIYRDIRNKQRKQKGLPPVQTAFEGLEGVGN